MSYSAIQSHQSMLFDDFRNTFYFNAIKEAVKKNSVVLDLGAGLGVHGFMANSCGAKKVYLVEPAEILDVTRMIVSTNGLRGKIECISAEIEKAALPEKVDVIISVFTGNFLLTEDLLPSLFYARDKYLRSGGKMIPDRAKMIIVPVSSVDYYAEHIECWSKSIHNIDYSAARKYAVNSLYYDSPKNRKVDFLAEPSTLLELDFMVANEAVCQSKIKIKITEDGTMHGCLGWFDTKVGERWLSTSPTDEQMHWRQVFLPLDSPISVKSGDIISLELNRPEFGEWSWIVEFKGKHQKYSTFLSRPQKLESILKRSKNYKGKLSQKGKAAQDVLQYLNGNNSIKDITQKILEKYPQYFTIEDQADRFVKNIVGNYSQ